METKTLKTEPPEKEVKEKKRALFALIKKSPFMRRLAIRAPESLLAVAAGAAIAMVVITGVQPEAPEPAIGAAMSGDITIAQSDGLKNLQTHTNSDQNCESMTGSDKFDCLSQQTSNMCTVASSDLSDADLEIARIAWKYFENNYNPETGLVNAVNKYPSTTMWDTGSALAAYIAAKDFDLINQKQFDDAMMALLETLSTIELFDGAAPNKVYNTKTRKMVDYGNKEVPGGIGVSVLDLARLVSWINTLQCMHPKYYAAVNTVISRWDYTRLIYNEEMYGMARDKKDRNIIHPRQEGRLGYEQYAGKIFERVGFSVKTSASYSNKWRSNTDILGVSIAFDSRDPREFFANNYVVTESYAMDAMELGIDDDNRQLLQNIYDVQKKRWQDTGIVTAISEDNIDRKPYFLYNSIFNAGLKFSTTNSSGVDYDHLKAVSTKAAMSMAMLFPDDPYSDILMSTISSAYDPEGGWYSGVYESGAGYNDVTTANTNGVIMGGLMYKKYGPLFEHCESCAKRLNIKSGLLDKIEKISECNQCETPRKLSLSNQ